MKKLTLFLIVIFALAASANADTWALPQEQTVCSENDKFCIKIVPKKLESQLSYFKDKVDGRNDAGADKKIEENYCKGVFYARDAGGRLHEKWKIKLVNEVSPVTILVSNDGDYVVTFDNWHGVGYGEEVVVIYDASKGDLIRKMGLSDFLTENDIASLPMSVSSIWWGGKHRIDDDNLVLKVTKSKQALDKNADYIDIRVELKTGKILDEKRDRLEPRKLLTFPN